MQTSTNDTLTVWAPRAQAVMRIVIAYVFLQHGTAKFFDIPSLGMQGIQLFSLMGLAGVLEIGGGLLMILGLFTRPVAFILCGFMAVAYFMAHAPKAFLSPLQNGGEPAVLYCFVFLLFAVAGAGAFSIDASRGKA
ncbi:DoxX family protein [Pigmentiphaga sp. NML030171]|uniref:DoxX family protein n=1 Tax=Pigmentiphaga sp. NML030171 TaxID=2008676 RepID=UPI000B40B28B|nr:DoxX family protein [Pigmentiphaga sp. NML030171]OVZ63262.1 DoxX family protein [Pigmentiphaga sp. NML030171]